MERGGRITDCFPRRHRARTRAAGKERRAARSGKRRGIPVAPPPRPSPPSPAQEEPPRDPPPAASRELLEMLRRFDLAWEYGPCTGITRLQRWERAQALGLSPPAPVREALLEHRDDPAVTYSLWHEYGL